MSDRIDPTAAQWGSELRRLRDLAGLTQGDLANMVNYSTPLISGWERGTRRPKRRHIEVLDVGLATGGALLALWDELSDTRPIPDSWKSFLKLEREAVEIREYQPLLIPGLFQSPGYAGALMARDGYHPDESTPEEQVALRMARLGELRRDTRLWAVVEETALRKVVGSREIHREALSHLLGLMALPHIHLTVVPEYAPQRPGLASGSFRLMRLPDGRYVGQVEHILGLAVVSNAYDLGRLVTLFGDVQMESMTPSDSRRLIEQIREGLE
ncbi:helix-turn-helix domain-containing protein [Nocardiopsis mangrovi]|uniref:Helix-turn-helix domain-containing protein n=1 Tax=Nocardiopsis mangrovi TaxID=1179818 RepID=A0ABV9DSQ4_9ACTN